MSEAPPDPAQGASRERWWALGLLFALGALVRGHHAFGETTAFAWHPDEGHVAAETLRIFCDAPGDADLRYPPLLSLLLGVLSGKSCDTSSLIAVGRSVSIVTGAAVGPLLAAALWRRPPHKWAALTAGALLCLSPLAIRMSRYAKPDMLAMFGVALCLLTCVRLIEGPSDRRLLSVGLALGATAMAKYTVVLIPLLAATFVLLDGDRLTSSLRRLAVAGLCALGLSLALLLFAGAGLEDLQRGLGYEWEHYNQRGHAGFDHDHPLVPAFFHLLLSSPGAIGLAVAGWGLATTLLYPSPTRRLDLGLVFAWLLASVSLAAAALFFARSLLPFLVVLAWWTGRGLADMPTRRARVFALACLVWPSMQAARQLPAFLAEDSRVVARRELPQLCATDCRLAFSPASVERVLSRRKAQRSRNVGNPPTVAEMRARGFTHFLYGAGTMRRFRKYPERYDYEDGYLQRFTTDLRANATLVRRWEGPRLPGDSLFGDAGFLHHHAALELWKLEAPARAAP